MEKEENLETNVEAAENDANCALENTSVSSTTRPQSLEDNEDESNDSEDNEDMKLALQMSLENNEEKEEEDFDGEELNRAIQMSLESSEKENNEKLDITGPTPPFSEPEHFPAPPPDLTALKILDLKLIETPFDVQLLLCRGILHLRMENYDKCVSDFVKAIEIDEKFVPCLNLVGSQCGFSNIKFMLCVLCSFLILRSDKKDSDYSVCKWLIGLALRLFKEGDYNPDENSLTLLGLNAMFFKLFVEAEIVFSKATVLVEKRINQVSPRIQDLSRVFFFRGLCRINTNNILGACGDFNIVISLQPNDPIGYFGRMFALYSVFNSRRKKKIEISESSSHLIFMEIFRAYSKLRTLPGTFQFFSETAIRVLEVAHSTMISHPNDPELLNKIRWFADGFTFRTRETLSSCIRKMEANANTLSGGLTFSSLRELSSGLGEGFSEFVERENVEEIFSQTVEAIQIKKRRSSNRSSTPPKSNKSKAPIMPIAKFYCEVFSSSLGFKREEEEYDFLVKQLSTKRKSDVIFLKVLGQGAYGTAYLCEVKGVTGRFVLKLDTRVSFLVEKGTKEKTMEKDMLSIPYHRNIVQVFPNTGIIEKLSVDRLPNYESFWKKKFPRVKFIRSGLMFMRYHYKDLLAYIFERRDQKTPLEDFEIYNFLKGLLKGVVHLHINKIVHRDLHPKNVFVDVSAGRVYIGDFGISLDLRNKKEEPVFMLPNNHHQLMSTSEGSDYLRLGGDSCYLPPEITEFNEDVEKFVNYEKCDVFSVGMLAVAMHLCSSDLVVERKIGKYKNPRKLGRLGLMKGMDKSLWGLIQNMLNEDLKKRISCVEAKSEIEAMEAEFRKDALASLFENIRRFRCMEKE